MSGDSYFSKSMSATVDLSDGITEISEGNITTNSITTNNFTTSNFQASTLTDGHATIQNGNITGVNTLSCNSFITSSFATPYIAVDTIQSTTINNQYYNVLDSLTNVIGQLYNQASTFVSTIYTTAMSNGWKWYYTPTSTTCMTLDNAGNLKTNSLQALSPSTAYQLLTNQTGAITIGGNQNININPNSSGTTTINNTLIKANSLQSGSTSAYQLLTNQGTINLGGGASTVIVAGTIQSNTIAQASVLGINIEGFNYNGLSIVNNTPTSAVSLLTTNTGAVFLGGSGGVNLAKQGNYYVEVNAASNAYIDFHSSNTSSDYDARIIATSGTSTAGKGTLNIIANTIQLYSNPFRYIPWTLIDTGVNGTSASLTNVLNWPIGANIAVCSPTATIKYRYSVVGNMLYLNYFFFQAVTTGASAGNGTYQYAFPSIAGLGFFIDTTNLIPILATGTYPYGGTKVGTASLYIYGLYSNTGNVFYSNLNGVGLTVWSQVGSVGSGFQSSTNFGYGTGANNLSYQFEAMMPIV